MPKTIDLSLKISIAASFFTRFKGLMFRKEPIKDEGLLILPCNSIHMFFMKFSIDVVLLSKEGTIIKTISDLKPWEMVPPVKRAYATLELPSGTLEKYRIKEGDRISVKGKPLIA